MSDNGGGIPCPPLPQLAVALGITGHRVIDPQSRDGLASALGSLCASIRAKVVEIGREHAALFDDCPPALTMVSPLAEGADRLAAEAALKNNYALHAMLPFPRDIYADDFAGDALADYNRLLDHAESVCELPARRLHDPRGYVLVGEATVAQCDILIAVWDGEESRGRGGTADVIDHAVRRGVPVIHVLSTAPATQTVLWSGFDVMEPDFITHEEAPKRALDETVIDFVIRRLIAPPTESPELGIFLAETEQLTRWRPEWSLMLASVGVQQLKKSSFRAAPYEEIARLDWATYRKGVEEACGPFAQMERLERAFAWADGLAQHYANIFRSGVVLNFAGAALAVLLSLMAGLMPQQKIILLLAELLVIAAVIANTAYGTRRQWHRRWLDYRFLAEQLRPLRSLRLLGAGSISTRGGTGSTRWTDWYAQAIWRTLGAPPTFGHPDALSALAEHVAAHELAGQVSYNRSSAHRMHKLDHRLHNLGLALFAVTILVGVGTLIGLLFAYEKVGPFAPLLGTLSAALPTLGAGIFGIRGAGDFAGTAGRSAETARRLEHVVGILRRDDIDQGIAARAAEQAAAIMLADLGEWRSTYTHRKLAIPS